VTLEFSEPVTPAGAGIKVYAPGGEQVATAAVARGSVLVASLHASETGTYVVSWQVFAADTHPSRGVFRFVVGRASANPYAALLNSPQVGTSTPAGIALQALAHWVHFVGFALVVGVVAYSVWIRPSGAFPTLVRAGVVLLIAAEPVALLGQLASLSFDGDTVLAVLGSGFGRLLGLRLGAALVLWTLLPAGRSWPLLATCAAIALLDGFGAHAINGLPLAGQLLVAVHVSAMGLWAGGLVALLRAPDPRFARFALITFGIAALTGLLLAFAHTHFGTALLSSDYGRVLILKVIVVGAAAAAALWRRRRIELTLVVAIVAAAAAVASLPPPY
jgi:copper transport protein